MPTVTAMLLASLAAWLVESPVPSMVVSLVVGVFAFSFTKRFLSGLRGGA